LENNNTSNTAKKDQMNNEKIEWTWSTAPILLPLAFEKREWNAVYIAFFLAEYSGASIWVVHVKDPDEDQEGISKFIEEMKSFASKLGVTFHIETIEEKNAYSSISDVAVIIVEKANEYHCQAVVMSAHRETFFRELFGRVSDNVTRKASCKVVLVETPHMGLTIPKNPAKILIPIIGDDIDPEPFILAAALTSSASTSNVEIIVTRAVTLPPTVPLDALKSTDILMRIEKTFSRAIAQYINSLGRLVIPHIMTVREVGPEISSYAEEIGADLMIISSNKPSGYRRLLAGDDYDMVKRASCIVLVAFPAN
jgi:nucleotide-binding universal stress UspA family protein